AVAVYFFVWSLEMPYATPATSTMHSRTHGTRRCRIVRTRSRPRALWSGSIGLHHLAASLRGEVVSRPDRRLAACPASATWRSGTTVRVATSIAVLFLTAPSGRGA